MGAPTEWAVHTVCGIAGFSIPADARVNARELAHVLLKQIETRGTHASGFAYATAGGEFNVYKNPTPGSQLSLGELPRNAKSVILHTRYATQGDARDNRNNHPVMSPLNQIALVHNGVISNDWSLREELGLTAKHGEVDSLVIPALLEQKDFESLSELSGYAAIAWLDSRESGELHIARLKSSPVSYTHLGDGTFVFASTPGLLSAAIADTPHEVGGIFDMDEGRVISVLGGHIFEHEKAPRMSYDYMTYQRYSGATSGGHGTTTKSATTKPAMTTSPEVASGSEDSCEAAMERAGIVAINEWVDREERADAEAAEERAAMALARLDDEIWDSWREDEVEDGYVASMYGDGFYILDGSGDLTHHPILEDLEARLRWLSKMGRTEYDLFPVEAELNWVNQIMDVGHIGDDGTLVSWVEDAAEIDAFESPAVRNLQTVREGAQLLGQLKGA